MFFDAQFASSISVLSFVSYSEVPVSPSRSTDGGTLLSSTPLWAKNLHENFNRNTFAKKNQHACIKWGFLLATGKSDKVLQLHILFVLLHEPAISKLKLRLNAQCHAERFKTLPVLLGNNPVYLISNSFHGIEYDQTS